MRKLAMLVLFAVALTFGTVSASHATPPDPCFTDDEFDMLNPQPLPPG